MPKALQGVRVLDLTHVLAGPVCTMFLADLGAEVIHIEPPQGEDAREFGPFIGGRGKNNSGYFISLNRNKKSMVLNLKKAEGKEILRRLVGVSDVMVENFRPDTMEKLGFGWEELRRMNPSLVYASISGFGHDTLPGYDVRPSYDMVAQAYSGLMSITGPVGGPPCRVGSSIGDIVAGHQAAIGILAALVRRNTTGKGQYYDGSMVDGLFSVLENAIVRYTAGGEAPGPLGSAHPTIVPFQGFITKDGSWLVVAVGNDHLWAKFCEVISRRDLIRDPRFKTNPVRAENREELAEILNDEMKKNTAASWAEIFERAGIPFSPINSVRDICEDPYIAHRKMLVEVDQPLVGKIKIVGSPIRMSETPGEVASPAPMLGEHSVEVLRDILDCSVKEIETLTLEGVIG
jgi:CoA:oxalate CoA-transferase